MYTVRLLFQTLLYSIAFNKRKRKGVRVITGYGVPRYVLVGISGTHSYTRG